MAPVFEFPVPVLSVAADAIRDLEGREALSGLWALFTKCKESIHDGHRLENISWRLWYRELALAVPGARRDDISKENDPRSTDATYFEKDPSLLDEKAPADEVCPSWIPDSSPSVPAPTALPRPPLLSRRNSSVGQMIVDILPTTTLSPLYPMSSSSKNRSTPSLLSPTRTCLPVRPSSVPVAAPTPGHAESHRGIPPSALHRSLIVSSASTTGEPNHSFSPVPSPPVAATDGMSLHPSTVASQSKSIAIIITPTASAPTPPSPDPELKIRVSTQSAPHSPPQPPHRETGTPPTLQAPGGVIVTPPCLPSPVPFQNHATTSPSLSAAPTPTSHPLLPRLVIVQPTPGATPHPTPPATPRLGPRGPEELEPVLTDDAGGLLTPSESSFSGITETSAPRLDTAITGREIHAAATAEPHIDVDPPSPHPSKPAHPHQPAPTSRASRDHAGKSSTSSAPAGDNTAQNRSVGGARSRTKGTARSTTTGPIERTKSKSTSRSRSPGGRGVGGLTMTTTTTGDALDSPVDATGGAAAGGAHVTERTKRAAVHGATRSAGKRPGLAVVGVRRTLSAGRVVGAGHANHGGGSGAGGKGKEKARTFNVGSGSDEGSATGSHSRAKSVGSGSDTAKKTQTIQGLRPAPPHLPRTSLLSTLVPVRAPQPGSALPPQQPQTRRLVLATDDSDDYETETDTDANSEGESRGVVSPVAEEAAAVVSASGKKIVHAGGNEDDDGDWASEEMSGEEERPTVRKVSGGSSSIQSLQKHGTSGGIGGRMKQQYQAQPHHHHIQQQQHQQPPRTAKRLQAEAQARRAQHTIEQAALEAERIRDMFVRKPVPSSEQLAAMRSKSVGLLTQLMNPDPRIFPVGHPYRRGFSSEEIAFGGGQGGAARVVNESGNVFRPTNTGVESQTRRHVSGEARVPRGLPPMGGICAPGLRLTKSSAALPVASQVQVGSVVAVQATTSDDASLNASGNGTEQGSTSNLRSPTSNGMNGGYRPRGRPADQELEDTESESEGEGGEGKGKNSILLSKSVAQEKLKALAMRRGIKPSTGTNESAGSGGGERKQEQEEHEPVPEWVRAETRVENGHGNRQGSSSRQPQQQAHDRTSQQLSHLFQQQSYVRHAASAAPAPIPVGHPYNLPPPAPPSTPRTTRRLMLQTEMSESLRRNLLWERQVSKVNVTGFRRTNSSGNASGSGAVRRGNVLGGGVQPLTGLSDAVQLTAKKGKGVADANRAGERSDEPPKVLDPAENERRALARTKSWANDFHYAGW